MKIDYIIRQKILRCDIKNEIKFVGVGIAQFITLLALASYYCSLMALTLFYLIVSFQAELPWGRCWEEWGEFCVDSLLGNHSVKTKNISYSSSAELYF